MSIGLLGQKIGMTSVYDANGRLRPVTVIAAGDNVAGPPDNGGERRLFRGASRVRRAKRIARDEGRARRVQESRRRAEEDLLREFRLETDVPEGEIEFERHAISAGRLRRCDRSLQRQRLPGRDEEAQLRTGKARRTVRRRIGATAPSAIVPLRAGSGKTWACPGTWVTSA